MANPSYLTQPKVNPVSAQPTQNQQFGGMGNPYVGTGWTNLSNFLNQSNLDWGNQQDPQQDLGTFDLTAGRSPSVAAFDNWIQKAGHQNDVAPTKWTGNPKDQEKYQDMSPPDPKAPGMPGTVAPPAPPPRQPPTVGKPPDDTEEPRGKPGYNLQDNQWQHFKGYLW